MDPRAITFLIKILLSAVTASGGAWPGSTLNTIGMFWDPTHPSSTNTTQRDELFVYDHQGQVGNNFRVYYLEQATQNIAGGPALAMTP
jgi:hypothetical protein